MSEVIKRPSFPTDPRANRTPQVQRCPYCNNQIVLAVQAQFNIKPITVEDYEQQQKNLGMMQEREREKNV